ncbi:MAG: hypothetical protein K9K66_04790 [Desulfarculaceae bacterium]|nr:hypothetical protein [Desulfarculaceae bacterium]MCF8072789.1 hypothetical protein [Desulfarculaceae bacterium]MCF8100957.1 hypothetical protein [Desulfarculaceae bacterium]MCF8117559.1 hypothetical protein [Desulfarculaceae bacterium]
MPPSLAAPSRAQRLSGLAVLLALVLVAAGVLWQQASYDPASWGWGGAAPGGGAGPLASLAVPGLEPREAGASFDPATLSDKIDGKAELYLAAGFERLYTRRYALKGQPAIWLELMLYRMKDQRAAFSVFSNQRRPGPTPPGLGPNAYATSNALYLANGPWYLEAVASAPDPALLKGLDAAARAIVAALPGDKAKAATPGEAELFPPQGLKPGSQVLLAKDAFGMAGLNQIFIAAYPAGAPERIAWLARRASPEAAQKEAEAYAKFLAVNGGAQAPAPKAIPGARLVELLGVWELVWPQGAYLAGVRGAESQEATLELALRLHQRLGGAKP